MGDLPGLKYTISNKGSHLIYGLFAVSILIVPESHSKNVTISGQNGELLNGCWGITSVPSKCSSEERVPLLPFSEESYVPTIGRFDIAIGANLSNSNNGSRARGQLSITDGGKLETGYAYLGFENNTTGTAVVSGIGSEWKVNSAVIVGHYGNGSLDIRDGGKVYLVNPDHFWIGYEKDSIGEVVVDGVDTATSTPSTLDVKNRILVGNHGYGKLIIRNGGLVNSGYTIFVGAESGSTGVISVDGVDSDSGLQSTLTTKNNNIQVGGDGEGHLYISNGGKVSVPAGVFIGYGSGSENNTLSSITVDGMDEVSGHHSSLSGSHFITNSTSSSSLNIINGGVAEFSVAGWLGNDTKDYNTHSNLTVAGSSSSVSFGQELIMGRNKDGKGMSTSIHLVDGGTLRTPRLGMYSNSTLVIGSSNRYAGNIDTPLIKGFAEINPGKIIFNHLDDIAFSPKLTGFLDVESSGGGKTELIAASTYSGKTSVTGGVLQAGGQNVLSEHSDFLVDKAGTLDLQNYGQNILSLSNAGVIRFGSSERAGTVLEINGNYHGDGGLLNMSTILGDDSSVTDKLVIHGDTSGITNVSVTNAGGSGAENIEGIEIVRVHGHSDGEFVKFGRIIAGAYDYSLTRGNGDNYGNWYLTSQFVEPEPEPEEPGPEPEKPGPEPEKPGPEPERPGPEPERPGPERPGPKKPNVRPESGSYTANIAAANTMFVTRMHDRLGEPHYGDEITGEAKSSNIWMRHLGGHDAWKDSSGQLDTQSNRYVLQLGGDLLHGNTGEDTSLHIGVMAGFGHNSSHTRSMSTGYSSRASVNGYSAGIYATWNAYNNTQQGVYVDSWVQYSWFDNSVKGDEVQRETYKSDGVTLSMETGYSHKISEFKGSKGTLAEWFIQPQIQAVWMGVKSYNHIENNGTKIKSEGSGNLHTRIGVRTFLKHNDKVKTFQPYIETNWLHNTRKFGTQLDGVSYHQSGTKNTLDIKAGIEGRISKKIEVWGSVGSQIGSRGYNDTSALLGFKYNF
ncbi:TPA: autotransporter outer membrane beta-barrel domain-containing protein [Citrobacter koseri]|uniref:autotransporter outer membrane beta-barrel domain-containing protein n=1 Tax=Citrobacter koseri TaxID=545 RepID=UPI00388EF1C1|nr:autotransporter outer membrane beta-barrel domain-containing protein [Citrobacter koseri]